MNDRTLFAVLDDFLPVLLLLGFVVGDNNVPVAFSERFRSNWDLSAARSAAVADYLLDSASMEGGNVMVTGLADTKPIMSNDTKEGRAKNRRIEIVIDGS